MTEAATKFPLFEDLEFSILFAIHTPVLGGTRESKKQVDGLVSFKCQ